MNIVILNLKIVGSDIRPANAVEERMLDIDDASALEADQVMMLMELRVEARCRTGVAGPGHKTKRNESPQDTVDRHAGDLRQPGPDRAVELLSGRMVGAILDRFKDRAALRGDRQAVFAVSGEEALYSLLFLCGTHWSPMNVCTR